MLDACVLCAETLVYPDICFHPNIRLIFGIASCVCTCTETSVVHVIGGVIGTAGTAIVSCTMF